jgi:hypothetical protein
MGHREYNESTIDAEFWREVFNAEVTAGPPKRIGEGQVGMNLRFALHSSDPAVPASIVVKLCSPDATSRATGAALRNYEREVLFYQELVDTIDVRSPRCYFSDWHPEGGDIVIVLEDMAPCEQGDQIRGCGIDEARLAVDQLVRVQGPRWNDVTLFDNNWLQRRGPDEENQVFGMFSMLKTGFLAVYSNAIQKELGDEGLAYLEQIEKKLPQFFAAQDKPFTITHGDFRLDNLLYATPAGGVACAVVDWQTPGHGNGVADLAYFIGAGLLPEDRRTYEWELVDQYIAGIAAYGHDIDHEWVKNHYRRGALAGVIMAVIASQIVGRTERGDLMFEKMATRYLLQAMENGALDLL